MEVDNNTAFDEPDAVRMRAKEIDLAIEGQESPKGPQELKLIHHQTVSQKIQMWVGIGSMLATLVLQVIGSLGIRQIIDQTSHRNCSAM